MVAFVSLSTSGYAGPCYEGLGSARASQLPACIYPSRPEKISISVMCEILEVSRHIIKFWQFSTTTWSHQCSPAPSTPQRTHPKAIPTTTIPAHQLDSGYNAMGAADRYRYRPLVVRNCDPTYLYQLAQSDERGMGLTRGKWILVST